MLKMSCLWLGALFIGIGMGSRIEKWMAKPIVREDAIRISRCEATQGFPMLYVGGEYMGCTWRPK